MTGLMQPGSLYKNKSENNWIILLLTIVLVLLFFFSLLMGRLDISIAELVDIFLTRLLGHEVSEHLVFKYSGFWMIRFPRSVMAIIIGAGLGVSGAVYQALFRNPLVSPDILGVSAGCTFGAALGLILPGNNFSMVHILSFSAGWVPYP